METDVKRKHVVRNVILVIIAALIIGVALYKIISGYIDSRPKFKYNYGDFQAENLVAYPNTDFAVMSDLHYYDTSLGTTGAAFEECMQSDRKLLKQSAELIGKAVDSIIASGVKYVLVSGDLTKDGELINHQKVAEEFKRIEDAGIAVYVVPGNHDVENPGAVKYDGDKTERVENVTEAQFAEIYSDFGYGEALMRDPETLSYVAEPQEGLWVVALDTCEYEKNTPDKEEVWAGELNQSQIDWTEGVLKQAIEQEKAVIILEHHGVVEHWNGQRKLHPDYLLSDYNYASKFYSSYGVRLAFTGHYHAQDITLQDNDSQGFIYDVETGSLITPPCALRFCAITNNKLTVKTDYLIDTYDADFAAESMEFVKQTIYNEAYETLKGYYVSDRDADYIANTVASSYVAHYDGDEGNAEEATVDKSRLNLWGKIIYSQYEYVINGLGVDLPPDDSNSTFSLGAIS